jgi:putative copper export protein
VVGLTLVATKVIHVTPVVADEALPATGRVAVVWAVAATLQALLVVSDLQAVPLLSADPTVWATLVRGLGESTDATAMLAQAALAAGVAWAAALARTPTGSALALGLAVAAFLPLTLIGHAATGNRLLGTLTLAVHVVAAALWVGGLAALAWAALRGRVPLATAVPRYSALAGVCVVALTVSGVLNAVERMHGFTGWFTSAYGLILVAKIVLLLVLVAFGWLHRQHTVERLRTWRRRRNVPAAAPVFVALAAVELAIMAATVALAVGLARTPPPVEGSAALPPAVLQFADPLPSGTLPT